MAKALASRLYSAFTATVLGLHALVPATTLAAAAATTTVSASAQKLIDRDKPRTDPANDPYTRGGDPELMKAAGYVSMASMEFGPKGETSDSISEFFSYIDLRFIETANFRLGIALPKVKVTGSERNKLREELTRLKEKLPDIDPRARVLDPWLRTHIYAQRLEDHYDKILGFLNVTEEDFAGLTNGWDGSSKYMGIGPYLGQRGKFEIMIFPSEGAHRDFMTKKLGLTSKLTQQHNYIDRDTLTLITHIEQEQMRVDEALHGHVVHSVTQILLKCYKHYSYESPIWVIEGCAHYFERQLNPKFNSFTSSEGGPPVKLRKEDWTEPVLKMVNSKKAPSIASIMAKRSFAELDKNDHVFSWSIIDYLEQAHPGFLATYFDRISCLKNDQGIDDAEELLNVQRSLFKDELGLSYAEFDRAWAAWVEENY